MQILFHSGQDTGIIGTGRHVEVMALRLTRRQKLG
jgi:hypothetical protein